MKKVLLAITLLVFGCDGRFVWVSNKDKQVKVMTKQEMNTNIAGVRFTFDDGPSLAYTPKILDILKKNNLQATFFVEGINLDGNSEQANERRDLLRRINNDGHWIGNHTYDHKDLCRMSEQKAEWEIEATQKLIEETIGHNFIWPPVTMRPPYGKKCRQLTKVIGHQHGISAGRLQAVYWDIDPREWERDLKTHQLKTADYVIDDIMKQYHNLHDEQGMKNMIIILHDTKKITVELLQKLIEKLSHTNNLK